MAAHYSPRKSSGPVLRSLSPSGRFSHQYSSRSLHGQSSHTTSSFASTTSSTFTNARSFQRPTSPTRVNMYNYTNRSVRFTLDRPTSPNRSISVSSREKPRVTAGQKRTCMCSPTNHPGSFRCSLHKGFGNQNSAPAQTASSHMRLNMRRSAMTNSLVRIGTVEGDLVKRALAALIRPSSHQQRRRAGFQTCKSRLSVMSKAEDH
ncbi:serine-rich protein-related [Forsythia ovata]|uniref:Serine-rich protein-related n=1 Tax=Forsythia ovata TaxID=205694 RepID=A0ABD1SJC1_9LAMI